MSAQDRIRWDTYYRQTRDDPYPAPDPLLFEYTPRRYDIAEDQPPRALDLAGGVGQNALWLAGQGYTVDLVEISREALKRAQKEMIVRNLRDVNFLQRDVDEIPLETARYDLVCVFRYLKRRLFPEIRAAIVPGGRVIYETFNIFYLDEVPGFNTAYLLEMGELSAAFEGWEVLYHNENGYISQFVARKPEDSA